MTVAFDAKATSDTAGHLPASPITNATLTIGGAATALVAYASIGTTSGTQPTISAMTWNGVAMTLLGSKVASDALNSLYVFGLANPATGNHTLSATISGSTANSDIYLDCASFTGTETSSTAACFPSGNVLTDASTQSGTVYPTTAFSVTTVSGDMALAAMANQAVGFTGVAAGTLLRAHAPNIGQCTWGYNPAVGATTSEQFTGGSSGSPSAGVAIRIAQPSTVAALGGSAEFYASMLGPEYRFKPNLAFSPSSTAIANNQTLAIGSVTSLSIINSVGKISAIPSVTLLTSLRVIGKFLSITSVSVTIAARLINKLLAIISTSVTTAIRLINKLLPVVSVSVVNAAAAIRRALTLAVGSSSSVTIIKAVGKILTVPSVTLITSVRSVGKILAIISTTVLTFLASKTKLLSLAITSVSVVSVIRAVQKFLAIPSVTSVILTKSAAFLRTLGITSITALTIVKSVSHTIVMLSVSVITTGIIKAKVVVLAIGSLTTVSAVRAVTKTLAIASGSVLTLVRSIAVHRSFSSVSVVSVVKSVGKNLAMGSITLVVETATRALHAVIAIGSVTVVTLKKSAVKAVRIVSVSVFNSFRLTGKNLVLSSSTVVSRFAGRAKFLTIAMVAMSIVTVSSSIHSLFSFTTVIGKAAQKLIGGFRSQPIKGEGGTDPIDGKPQ